MPRSWFIYIGGPDASQFASGNYRLLNNGNKPACVNGTVICAIYSSYDGDAKPLHPLPPLSTNLLQYLTDALGTQVAQPQFPANTKRYVYLKTFSF